MLLQVALMNQLAQMQLDRIAVYVQQGDCFRDGKTPSFLCQGK